MLATTRKPVSIGEILVEEFMRPMNVTRTALAEAIGVQRKQVDEMCNNHRPLTAATAEALACIFSNTPDFWLNLQRRNDLWKTENTPKDR